VRGFGKIKDFDTTLSNGLNVIYGPNESGKSTLMEFIKAMLYGLKGGRASKDGILVAAKRYMPWSSSAYGGYMNFELDDGSSYRIDRAFDNGTVKLYDESFNEITSSFADIKDGSSIAQRLIGLNESLFERTVYIKQLGTRIDTSASKDLIDRISNIRQSGAEDISYKRANAALKDALKQQVGTDRSYTRPLDIINKRLGELNTSKIKIKNENKSLLEARIKQEELASQISKLTGKERLFAKLLEFCELKERLKLQQEKNDEIEFLNERIRQSQNEINILDKDRVMLEQNIDNNSEYIVMLSKQQGSSERGTLDLSRQNSENSVKLFQEDVASKKATENFQENASKQNTDKAVVISQRHSSRRISRGIQDKIAKQKKWIKALYICIIASFVAIIGVGCGAIVFKAFAAWLTIVPVLMAMAFIALRLQINRWGSKLEEQNSKLYDSNEQLKTELNNAQKIDRIFCQQLVSLNDRINNEKTQYEQLIKRLENLNISSKQVEICTIENEIDRVSKIVSENRKVVDLDLSCTEKELFENIIEDNSDRQCLRITELKEFLTAQLQQKKLESAIVETNIKKTENIQKDELLEDEITRLSQQKEQLEQRGEALGIAIKILEEATSDVQKKYIPIMNKVFKSTFSELTAQKYSDIRAGEDLNIMLSDPKTEIVVPVSTLSSGTIDQMYLALRIAIAETVLKTNEGLPFIMDEPFAQYDDKRTDQALSCIYEISKKQQVVFFTCKQREVDLISSKYPCKICSLT
jgi:DNA repair exonuclease SbcCD ATPase subunit